MIETIKLTRISSTNQKKDGTPLEGKYGAYYRVGIQTEQHGESWLNGFSNKAPTWEVGDELQVEIKEGEWNGNKQLSFRIAKEEDILKAKVAKLEADAEKKEDPVVEVAEDDDEDAF